MVDELGRVEGERVGAEARDLVGEALDVARGDGEQRPAGGVAVELAGLRGPAAQRVAGAGADPHGRRRVGGGSTCEVATIDDGS